MVGASGFGLRSLHARALSTLLVCILLVQSSLPAAAAPFAGMQNSRRPFGVLEQQDGGGTVPPPVEEPADASEGGFPAAVYLRINSVAVVAPGELFEATVTVEPSNGALEAGYRVLVTLPGSVQLAADSPTTALEWELPALGVGQVDARTLRLVATGEAGTANISVRVSGPGVLPVERVQSLVVALPEAAAAAAITAQGAALWAADGGVAAALPAGAEARLRYAPLYDWRKKTQPEQLAGSRIHLPVVALEAPSLAAATSEMAAPAEGAPALPTWQDQGIDFYSVWELEADVEGDAAAAEVLTPDGEALLVVDVGALVERGVNPHSLDIFTREQDGQPWKRLRSEYDSYARVLRTWLPHFSQFGLGEGLDSSGDMLPSVKAFTADELTGGANVNIPIEAPAGLGGLSPQLSLNYSSILMDDLFRESGDYEIETQAGSAGFGWNLGGVSYIARADGDLSHDYVDIYKDFALVLNGTRTGITYAGEWHTNPEIFAKVEWLDAGKGKNGDATDWYGWVVTMPDGMRYEFGDANGFTNDLDSTSAKTSPNATFVLNDGSQTFRLTKRWYLRKVTDPLGNTIEYHYRTEQQREQQSINMDWIDTNRNWYTSAVDLEKVVYSANAGAGAAPTMQVLFSYHSAARDDTRIKGSELTDGDEPMYGVYNQLASIAVQVSAGGQWRSLRTYRLNQSVQEWDPVGQDPTWRLLLNSIDVLGEDDGVLRSYSFTYTPTYPNQVWLKTANNGWSGSVAYTYTGYRVSCGSAVCGSSRHTRYAVNTLEARDGLGSTVKTAYYYGPLNQVDGEWGAVADDGGFLGFKQAEITYYDTNSTAVLKWERLESFGSGAEASRDNPDPRRGKIHLREVYDKPSGSGGVRLSTTTYNWQAYWFKDGAWQLGSSVEQSWEKPANDRVYPPTWIRLESETQDIGGAVTAKAYRFSSATTVATQFGNVTEVHEKDGDVTLRVTKTEYFPNVAANIVQLPSRVRVYDGSGGACYSDIRTSYLDPGSSTQGRYVAYTTPPKTTLPIRFEEAISACGADGVAVSLDSAAWAITLYRYDPYGNQDMVWLVAGDGTAEQSDITYTTYDSIYHLFPVKQYKYSDANHAETARYYGVSSGLAATNAGAYWGAMAEHCGVNGVCTQQQYDQFGRRTLHWENVAGGGDPSAKAAGTAAVRWDYFKPGAYTGGGNQSFIVREWRQPRCFGNFTRSHYNGFGQLVATQTPHLNWQHETGTNDDTCAGSDNGGDEIHTYYAYNGLGAVVRQSAPKFFDHTVANETRATVSWSTIGYTTTTYDALSRPGTVTAPNGMAQFYTYNDAARATALWGKKSLAGEYDKVLQRTDLDALGNVRYVRSYTWNGSAIVQDAVVTLSYDPMGNLVTVTHPNSLGVATLTYDKAGRKTKMDDPDMGEWTYAYDRLGRLTRQTDARGKTVCLYYDSLGRLAKKHFAANTSCPANPAGSVLYTYGASGASKGQLTRVEYTDGSYTRSLTYNGAGLLNGETVTVEGVAFTYSYGYDAWLRPETTTYPDGEVVTVSYNSMGLQNVLSSSVNGTMVDRVNFDEASRLTSSRYHLGGGKTVQNTLTYEGWAVQSPNGGMLKSIAAQRSDESHKLLSLDYQWDSFGNVKQIAESYDGSAAATQTFAYDASNRLTSGYGKSYAYDATGRTTSYEGIGHSFSTAHPAHSLKNSGYTYDANGNMTARSGWSLTWDHENRLASASHATSPDEVYGYDPDGARVYKQSGNQETFYAGGLFEYAPIVAQVTAAALDADLAAQVEPQTAPEELPSDPDVDAPAPQPARIVTSGEHALFAPVVAVAAVGQSSALPEDGAPLPIPPEGSSENAQAAPPAADEPLELPPDEEMAALGAAVGAAAVTADGGLAEPGFEAAGGWSEGGDAAFPNTVYHRNYAGAAAGRAHPGDGEGKHYGQAISNQAYGSLQSGYIDVVGGAQYEFSAWLRGEIDADGSAGGWLLYVRQYASDGSALPSLTALASTAISTAWQERSGVFTTAAGCDKVRLSLLVQYVSGWVAFDDVEFKRAGATANLAPDPGFELGTGWTEVRAAGYDGMSFYRSGWGAATPHGGAYAYTLSNHAYGYLYADVTVPVLGVDAAYEFYAYLRGELDAEDSAGVWLLRAWFYQANGASNGYLNVAYDDAIAPTWTRYGGAVDVPAGTARVQLQLYSYMNSGWVAFDDVEFRKPGGPNLAPDPGFEAGSGWQQWRSTVYPGTSLWRNNWGTAKGRNGGYAYVISNHVYGVLYSNYVTAAAGAKLDVQALVRGRIDAEDSASGWLVRAYFYDASGGRITQVDVGSGSSLDGGWQLVSGQVTAPAGTASMRVALFNYLATGWATFDDVSIQPTTTRYYLFNGQRVAMRVGDALTYLHTDHLGSVVATSSAAASDKTQQYFAYGKRRGGAGVFPTERGFTGQPHDASGLVYMNARYYDPAVGQFVSPDTLVPDPSVVMDYNRYAYARGNPLKYNDPTGHETNKPGWWPDWLPYTFDLPDDMTLEDFDQWIAENNIYTVIGGQLGANGSIAPYVGEEGAVEAGWLFNWRSGELVYWGGISIGASAGSPDIGGGVHAGVTFLTGAGPGEAERSLIGLSRYSTITGDIEALGLEASASAAWTRAYSNLGDNRLWVLDTPLIDRTSQRTVDALTLNLGVGEDVISFPQQLLPEDLRFSHGLQNTTGSRVFNVYGQINRIIEPIANWFSK